jgi:Flp pilus assembly protein TadG
MNDIAPASGAARKPRFKGKGLRALFRRGEDGSSLIEFALCLPPLMLLMTGIFAFGIAIGNYVMLTNATSAAAMQLSISRGQLASPSYDPCATAVAAVEAAAPTLTAGSLKFAFNLDGNAYASNTTSCSSTSQTTGAAAQLVEGQAITITVTYPCNLTVYKANNFPSCLLTAKASELVQ